MIVFDLRCSAGHVFEAWFGASADYEDQSRRKLIACPICGADDVAKAAMAPAIPDKSNRQTSASPTELKAMLSTLAKAQSEALKKSDYVGDRFVSEARAIHLGEAEARSIHGQATRSDAQSLIEDGVKVSPLPFPVVPPGKEN